MIKPAPIPPKPEHPMQVTVITVIRNSSRFVSELQEIPSNAILRMEGQRWNKEFRV